MEIIFNFKLLGQVLLQRMTRIICIICMDLRNIDSVHACVHFIEFLSFPPLLSGLLFGLASDLPTESIAMATSVLLCALPRLYLPVSWDFFYCDLLLLLLIK